jgi:secondary thiamine-phosphate synthase enzyme
MDQVEWARSKSFALDRWNLTEKATVFVGWGGAALLSPLPEAISQYRRRFRNFAALDVFCLSRSGIASISTVIVSIFQQAAHHPSSILIPFFIALIEGIMKQHQQTIVVRAARAGLHSITADVQSVVSDSNIRTGLCVVFVRHTSASLLIQENADRTARKDLENWFDRVAPEGDPAYTHVAEGADDMPSHIRAALTSTSETIPVTDGELALGVWQGLYLFEHRARPTDRRVVVHIMGV